MTASTTPSGLKSTKLARASVATLSRAKNRAALSAKKSHADAHFCTSAIPSRTGLPISCAMRRANAPASSRRMAATFRIGRARSANDARRHSRKALWTSPTMRAMVVPDIGSYFATSSPVAGLIASIVIAAPLRIVRTLPHQWTPGGLKNSMSGATNNAWPVSIL